MTNKTVFAYIVIGVLLCVFIAGADYLLLHIGGSEDYCLMHKTEIDYAKSIQTCIDSRGCVTELRQQEYLNNLQRYYPQCFGDVK